MENVKQFRTKDFYQSCVLKTLGFPLSRLERGRGNFITFVFEDPESKANLTIENYWNRKIQVVARDLIESINELKTRIHSCGEAQW